MTGLTVPKLKKWFCANLNFTSQFPKYTCRLQEWLLSPGVSCWCLQQTIMAALKRQELIQSFWQHESCCVVVQFEKTHNIKTKAFKCILKKTNQRLCLFLFPQDLGWTVDLPWPSLNFWTTLSMRSEECLFFLQYEQPLTIFQQSVYNL